VIYRGRNRPQREGGCVHAEVGRAMVLDDDVREDAKESCVAVRLPLATWYVSVFVRQIVKPSDSS
jgi:hypothetical protein